MSALSALKKCKSWEEFKSLLGNLPSKGKGDCFEELVQNYLQLEPRYSTKLQDVWLLSEVPPKIRKKLNLPGSDEGIDIVAQTKEGTFWAIQCKYREDESKSLTRRELSTFTDLAFAVCNGIELALVCTTADRLSHKLALYGDRISFVTGEDWRKLEADFFRRLRSRLAGRIRVPKPLKPRPHQKRAIRNALKHFTEERNLRGKMIMPCGTGKSLTGYWIAEELGAKSILVAVPSLALIKQTLEVWTRESVATGAEVDWICVCSDQSVARSERDDLAVLTQDLGVKVHTDPDLIASWLRKRGNGRRVVFTTYQSGKATAEAARKARRVFDLAILDEAHKTVGKKGSTFSHLLDEGNIRIRKRVFMTATERRYRGASDEIASMDNSDLYGDTFELLSFSRALESKPPILSDYKIVTIAVAREELSPLIEKNLVVQPDKGRWDEDLEAGMLASAVALRKALLRHPIRHAVTFHSTIARARSFKGTQDIFSETFPDYGELETFHVSGKTPTAVRSRELESFAGAGRSLVTNARCLTEGVDVPNIDCVLFADPKKSTIDIVQAVGRALRPAEGKQFGYVVVPILLDDEVSEDRPVPKSAFDSILMVLRALASNDERIIEYFRAVSQGRRPRGQSTPFEIDIPLGLKIDADAFIESVGLQVWPRLAKLSWMPFDEAREYVNSVGLRNFTEWREWAAGRLPEKGTCPPDIPSGPARVYAELGWTNWGDWLGTGRVASYKISYRPFPQALEFARSLGLNSIREWTDFCRGKMPEKGDRPPDIPTAADRVYREDGWTNWGDWLGTGNVAPYKKRFRSFEDARRFARKLGLKSSAEWNQYCRGEFLDKRPLPKDISPRPDNWYKGEGWKSWGDWLGTRNVFRGDWRSYEEARAFVHGLGLKNGKEWRAYASGSMAGKGTRPIDIPSNVEKAYARKGWTTWRDWLGNKDIPLRRRTYRPFNEARSFIRSLGLKNWTEWRHFSAGRLPDKGKRPEDIPSQPQRIYRDQGWISFGDWLGTGNISVHKMKYKSFGEARTFARGLKIRTVTEWREYCAGRLSDHSPKPRSIPSSPHIVYRNSGWKNWRDWLGTGTISSH